MTGPAGAGGRRLDVQGLRGVAVLLVVAFHAELGVAGGFVGVDVFFVISGFVITRLLLRQLESTATVSLATFYARRARRLLPLLAVTLVVTTLVALVALAPRPAGLTTRTATAGAVFNANTYLGRQSGGYFALEATENGLLHIWSLSVEEQFYFVLPALLLLAWKVGDRRRRPRRWLAGAALAAAVVSGLVALVTGSGRGSKAVSLLGFAGPEQFMFFAAPARAWEFLVGALVACAETRLAAWPRAWRGALGMVGVGLVALAAATFDGTGSFTALHAAVPVAGAALVLLPGLATATPDRAGGLADLVAGALATRPLTWLGDRSYAWYLTHWPMVVVAAAWWPERRWVLGVAAGVSLLVAALAHRTVEDRFRVDDRLAGRRAVALAVVCILGPAAVGVGASLVNGRAPVPGLDAAERQHFVYTDECPDHTGAKAVEVERCRRPADAAVGAVWLIGDSHAGHWAEAVDAAAGSLHLDLTIVAQSSCPLLPGLATWVEGETHAACRSATERTYDAILAERPDVVVLGLSGPGYVEDGTVALAYRGTGPVHDAPAKARIWEQAVRDAVEVLDANGVATVLVHDNPRPSLPPSSCSRLRHAVDGCRSTRDRAAAEAFRERAFTAEAAASDGGARVTTLDPFALLCDTDGCPNIRDGEWLYRDANHLSVAASIALAGPVETVIAEACDC